jgi:POT family proton-dependent oligopeptide transporter
VLYISHHHGDDPERCWTRWTSQEALALRMVHHVSILMSIPGGMIADKLIGQKKALVGAIVLCIGHGVSAYSNLGILYRIRTCGLRSRLA